MPNDEAISGHPESNQGPSDSCKSLQSDALPTELRPDVLCVCMMHYASARCAQCPLKWTAMPCKIMSNGLLRCSLHACNILLRRACNLLHLPLDFRHCVLPLLLALPSWGHLAHMRCCEFGTSTIMSPHWGLNPGPSVYKTDALPLSYRGTSCLPLIRRAGSF